MPDIVSGPSLTSARTGPGTLAGPVWDATEPDAAARRLRGPSSRDHPLRRGPLCCDVSLASEAPSSMHRACDPLDVSGSWSGSGLGHGRTGLPRYHHARARTLQARASPPVTCMLVAPPRCPPGGTTAVVYATSARPLRGRHQATLSDGPAGSEARMRPHRPQPAPEVFPMQSVATAPRGDRSQAALRVPHARALRPCRASSCSVRFATSPVRMVEHPTGPFASGFQHPSLRGVVRAQARTEARA